MKKTISSIILIALLITLLACNCIPSYADSGTAPLPEGSNFTIHYIDVGQADAALVLCDDAAMLIDGGNREDSSLIYTYLSDLSIDHLAKPPSGSYLAACREGSKVGGSPAPTS